MPNEFHFKIVNDKIQKYYMQCKAMHIMAAIFIVIYAMPYLSSWQENWIMVLGLLLPAIVILIIALFKKQLLVEVNNNRIFRILEAGFLLMGSMHYLQANKPLPAVLYTLVAMVMLFLLWMESRLLTEQYLVFMPHVIEVEKALATKKYTWQQLQLVTVKNNYITLHLNGNSFEQIKVMWPKSVEPEEFLAYCNERIDN